MSDYRRNITADVMDDEAVEERRPQFTAFNEKNYLNVKLGKTEDSKELKIRLLPVDKNTDSPFKTIYMHQIQVAPEISQGGWKSYVCLNKTEDIDHDTLGHDCPFCEMNKIAYDNMKKAEKEGDKVEQERWKKISLANRYSEVCVIRCIERGAEDDGPKFWKFNVRSDGKDPKNLIKALYKTRKQESIDEAMEENDGVLPKNFVPDNILDLYDGKDLKVTISAVYDKEGRRTNKTSISIVDYGKFKPLSKYEEDIDEWVNDDKVWSDVFVAKPYEYLSIILDGEVPFYDKTNGKWVSKGRVRDEETKEHLKEEAKHKEKLEKARKKAVEYDDDEYDDDDEADELPD